jgi:F5/8 type C domain
MRKRIIEHGLRGMPSGEPREWLNLERLTQIEVTSEDAGHPIESALMHAGDQGWWAEGPGEQTIRLLLDEPVKLRRVRLVFREELQGRTQEFVLRWSPDGGRTYQEIVRQQYTFSPPSTTREIEEYAVALGGVTALELRIVPDISGGDAHASLERMQLAST